MSTYYNYAIFYKNKETGEIKQVSDLRGSFNKGLLSGWELDPLIEETDYDTDWREAVEKTLEFESTHFKGYYKRADLSKYHYYAPTESQARNFPATDLIKCAIPEAEWTDDKQESVDPKEADFAVCLFRNKTYKRGWWLDASSLNKYIERHYKLLKEDILKKERWEKMSQSLDYLKLSDKEKDRVRESMDADWLIDDEDIWDPDDNYNFYSLRIALELKGAMLAFKDYDTEVRLFIYNLDDSEPVTEVAE